MDKTKVANYVILREEGKSYQEIADIYNVSKQSVEQALRKFEVTFGRVRKNNTNIERIAYKGLYNFFIDNPNMTFSKLTRLSYGYSDTKNTHRIMNLLFGKNVRINIKTINKLIEITEKPYEVLFELRECE